MELIEGKAYLCEVWFVPPGFGDCETDEKRLEILKFEGYYNSRGQPRRTMRCGSKTFELKTDGRLLPTWQPMPHSLLSAGLIYNVEPIRILLQDETSTTTRVSEYI